MLLKRIIILLVLLLLLDLFGWGWLDIFCTL
jgi:hypothetical protein